MKYLITLHSRIEGTRGLSLLVDDWTNQEQYIECVFDNNNYFIPWTSIEFIMEQK